MQLVCFRRSDPGHSIMSSFQDLCSFSEANLNGFVSANINFKDMNIVHKVCQLDSLENSFQNYMCIKCPEFSKHVRLIHNFISVAYSLNSYRFYFNVYNMKY